jgi:hypothetical protein
MRGLIVMQTTSKPVSTERYRMVPECGALDRVLAKRRSSCIPEEFGVPGYYASNT